jgi:AraC family transcriptional regulator of adaptative response/methylated-DNA-[protein]-cysteine methyltransferase
METLETAMRPGRSLDEAHAWQAVLRRDAGADGRLYYAVGTTGVYCRPSCPSRRPRRENTRFFRTPGGAERAGYRPCLRCAPAGKPVAPIPGPVAAARAYLDAHADEPVALARLGREAGMSPHHLQRRFKGAYGVTPKEYQDAARLRRLKAGLRAGDSVTGAIVDAGYGSPSRVYERSDARLGMPPGAYRRGGAGMVIRYATAATPLGRVLVGATDRGVCAVSLGDDDARLVDALRAEYPRASLEPARGGARGNVAEIARAVAGDADLRRVPLDVRGTAFQQRVWSALRAIPRGETRSYAEVAAAIGQPRAARAVAAACAANPVALVVPCHRVVRSGGGPGGYRWGAERKRALLEGEARSRRRPAVSGRPPTPGSGRRAASRRRTARTRRPSSTRSTPP